MNDENKNFLFPFLGDNERALMHLASLDLAKVIGVIVAVAALFEVLG